jgi:hypothetical protein
VFFRGHAGDPRDMETSLEDAIAEKGENDVIQTVETATKIL